MNLRAIFGFIILFSNAFFSNAEKLKFCIVKIRETARVIQDICPILELPGHDVKCVTANDRLACMRLVTTGVADFTVFEPEDLIVAIEILEYHIMITHELRVWKNETERTQVVAIVHKDINDLSDIRKRRLCYPGFEASNIHNKDYTSYFETKIIPRECDSNKTLVENRISSLSHYFEAACVAGAWSSDASYDSELKSKYRNLCALCDNPLGCYSDDKYYGREGTLLCLTENVGDVTWTTLSSVRLHFQTEDLDENKFNYLCPDGTVRSMTSEPCIWIGEPWPVIIARADVAEQVSQLITRQVDVNGKFLRLLKDTNTYRPPIKLRQLESPETYLQKFPGFLNAESPSTCYPPRDIRWCVSSNLEYRKCQSLGTAALAYGVKPLVFCVQESSRRSCLDAVRKRQADVFVTRPDEELEARKNGLKPILHMLPNKREDLNKVGALVAKHSNYTFVKDLKGAKACFTNFRSVGWNAFVAVITNNTKQKRDCSDAKVVSKFFGDSCVFGLSKKNETMPKNLYSLCNNILSNNLFRRYSNDEDIMALKCLVDSGDVAFLNVSRAKEIFEREGGHFYQRYKLLCIDESDDSRRDCFLTWTTLGSIMVHENETAFREEEIRSTLLEMNRLFGQTFLGRTPLFSLYGSYENTSNVIFPEKTKHLQREVSHVRHGRSYTDILNELVTQQVLCNKSNKLNTKSAKLLVVFVVSVLYFT